MDRHKQHKYIVIFSWIFGVLLLLTYGSGVTFVIASTFLFLVMVLRATKIGDKKTFRFYLIVLYFFVYLMQLVFYGGGMGGMQHLAGFAIIENVLRICVLVIPLVLEYLMTVSKYTEFYLPSTQEMNTMNFRQVKAATERLRSRVGGINQLRQTVTMGRIIEIAADLPRHSSIRYINEGSLTKDYFDEAQKSLDDPYIYLLISTTGTAASEIISVFTRKQYNHASLSFDGDLNTIISYNGGEKVYPPGLNQEMIEFFNKKQDASLIVYRLYAGKEKKEALIQIIKDINDKGSAYNLLGLVFRTSMKPNIMFCSQFVYSMLTAVGLEYFTKDNGKVKPTDLVEQDYYRKLEFAYEIFLNERE